jgi:hypothetical protein
MERLLCNLVLCHAFSVLGSLLWEKRAQSSDCTQTSLIDPIDCSTFQLTLSSPARKVPYAVANRGYLISQARAVNVAKIVQQPAHGADPHTEKERPIGRFYFLSAMMLLKPAWKRT